MHVNTQLSSFVDDKQNDPTFWAKLIHERGELCSRLHAGGDCPELVEALRACSDVSCGLAACPVCMARADQDLFQGMNLFCQAEGHTVFVTEGFGFDEQWPTFRHRIERLIPRGKNSFVCYAGRQHVVPSVDEISKKMVVRMDPGFAGALHWEGCDLSLDELKEHWRHTGIGLQKIDVETNFYDEKFFLWFDKNAMTEKMREGRKIRFTDRQRKRASKIEDFIAKSVFGQTSCDSWLTKGICNTGGVL